MAAPSRDAQDLKDLAIKFLNVPSRTAEYNDHPLVLTLDDNGIEGFKRQFLHLRPGDAAKMMYHEPPADPADPPELRELPFYMSRRIDGFIQWYHNKCREVTQETRPLKVNELQLNEFARYMLLDYNPDLKFVPMTETPKSEKLANWQ